MVDNQKSDIIEEPKEKIPPFMADPDKLRDVILNFVDNAIKYTPAGRVWVEVSAEPRPKQLADDDDDDNDNNNNSDDNDSDDNDTGSKIPRPRQGEAEGGQDSGVVVRINDTGMGLDPEDAKKLFDKFSRVKGIAQIHPHTRTSF